MTISSVRLAAVFANGKAVSIVTDLLSVGIELKGGEAPWLR